MDKNTKGLTDRTQLRKKFTSIYVNTNFGRIADEVMLDYIYPEKGEANFILGLSLYEAYSMILKKSEQALSSFELCVRDLIVSEDVNNCVIAVEMLKSYIENGRGLKG